MSESKSKFNILKAFLNIVQNPGTSINPAKVSNNRINNVGDALEGFVKDSLVGILGKDVTDSDRDLLYSKAFSWLGNTGNPPDCMIKDGDAFEVKKLQALTSDIALNSSYPKNKIFANDKRIASGARNAEEWSEKDIVYAIGSTKNGTQLQRLWFIYGDCYAASKDVYEKLINAIAKGVLSVEDVEFQKTNELGKVKKVDPLGITNMRVRGMWHITNPSRLYSQLVNSTQDKQFYLLMREEKYKSFSASDREELESIDVNGFSNLLIDIRDPDNPAKMIKARFIKYEI